MRDLLCQGEHGVGAARQDPALCAFSSRHGVDRNRNAPEDVEGLHLILLVREVVPYPMADQLMAELQVGFVCAWGHLGQEAHEVSQLDQRLCRHRDVQARRLAHVPKLQRDRLSEGLQAPVFLVAPDRKRFASFNDCVQRLHEPRQALLRLFRDVPKGLQKEVPAVRVQRLRGRILGRLEVPKHVSRDVRLLQLKGRASLIFDAALLCLLQKLP
mmetsp:Transcript_105620/g.251816  ORF Transcript_105620/g.251816 Transcript_105620/m.251816 type:complete len:214 (+) Transcript_105620:3550-4191(+)